MKTTLVIAASLTTVLVAGSALAQDPPPSTPPSTPPADSTVKAEAKVETQAPPVATAQGTTPTVAPAKDDGNPDHERVIGHLGVTYFNITQIPIAGPVAAGLAPPRDNVNAPVVGVRYWLNRRLGIDIGAGIGHSSGEFERIGTGGGTGDRVTKTALALHGGVPIAFANGRHYSFLLIPEFTVGFGFGSQKAPPQADHDLSGFKLDVGARIGAEIYFGFIGVPELALNASVGAFLRREAWKAKQADISTSEGAWLLGTSVQSDPWALFTNNISAIYYF